MKQKVYRVVVSCISAVMILSAVACGGQQTPSDQIDVNYEWLNGEITETSRLTDYAGNNHLALKAWNVNGLGQFTEYESSNDVVSSEIERVTGVKIASVTDNRGNTADGRYTQMLSAKDVPDIAFGSGWIDKDELWDLTELIDEYCPTIKARMPESVWNNTQVNGGEEGKIYGIPYGIGSISLSTVDPLAQANKTSMFAYHEEYYPWIWVRDDILTDAYPNAKTADEIDALFAEKGYFTEEDLFDVEITSAEQFRTEFLPNIANAIHTKKNDDGSYKYQITANRWVEPMLITEGSDNDNWSFLGVLMPSLLGSTYSFYNHMFSYWDVTSQQVEIMMTQDFYKNELYEWGKLIDEGTKLRNNNHANTYLVSNAGMTTQHATIQSELNNGYYAIGYMPSMQPSGGQCTFTGINGKTQQVKYRKVYMKIERDIEHFEYFVRGEPALSSVMFFKDSVRESDLPQLLRWLDYQCSRVADNLYAWGPETAGLFTETNGVRRYNNEELANQMVYSTLTMGPLVQKYNLSNGTLESAQLTFPFFYAGGSIVHPKCTYDLSQMQGLATSNFSSAVVCTDKVKEGVKLGITASIDSWTNANLAGVEEVFSKRKLIEDQLKQILISGSSKANFDNAYSTLENILKRNGWTDDYFNGKFTNKFLELNEVYLDGFYQ